jgi:hypothetical protein
MTLKKRIINTSLRDYEKDLGISELEKKIEIMEKQLNKESGCLYAFIDVKREFVPNGALYMGQSQAVKNRMVFYKSRKNSELLVKLQKRFNLWGYYWGMEMPDESQGVMGPDDETEEEIDKLREFIRDPERCRLIIRANDKFNDPEVRKKWEKLYIKRYMPLLNKTPWKPYQPSYRRFYMNQLHPDPEQRNTLPVYCLHTGDVLAGPTEEYITHFNEMSGRNII